MPRRPRVFAGGAAYHVYCRFAHGATAFADQEGARRFLANRREVVRTGGVAIHTVSRWVTRGAQQGVSDEAFGGLVTRLEERLTAQ